MIIDQVRRSRARRGAEACLEIPPAVSFRDADRVVDRLRRQRDHAWDEVGRLRRELAEQRRQAWADWYAARRDDLTGLPNRRALREYTLRPVFRTAAQVGCAVIDLNGFKQINDRYGHRAGDAVLVAVASRIADYVRTGAGRFAARLAGDEFAVLAACSQPPPDLDSFAAGLADLFDPPPPLPGAADIEVTAAIGITHGTGITGLDVLLARADAAMYQAKHPSSAPHHR